MGTDELLALLAARQQPDGTVPVVLEELAAILGLSTSTVFRKLQELEQQGYVKRIKRGARGQPAYYQLLQAPSGSDALDRLVVWIAELSTQLQKAQSALNVLRQELSYYRAQEARVVSRSRLPGGMEQWLLKSTPLPQQKVTGSE